MLSLRKPLEIREIENSHGAELVRKHKVRMTRRKSGKPLRSGRPKFQRL
jgi:hypothetical protein